MNVMRRWLALCLLLCATALHAAPDFPALTGRVVDEANLMSRKQAHQLAQQLAVFEKRSGVQLVVVSIDTLAGDTIEEYGYQLGRHWGIGQKGKNNGVLLIIAQDERKVRIEVGYGLEGALPDAIAANIIQTRIPPAFKRGDMVAGISPAARASCRPWPGVSARGPRQQGRQAGRSLALHPGGDCDDRAAQPAQRRRWAGRTSPGRLHGRWIRCRLGGRTGGGGGGFSGGGGSFGGGGASGGW
jgi:uncharacterized protein